MFECVNTRDPRRRKWVVMVVLLLIFVVAEASLNSTWAEVLIRSTLVVLLVGLMFGFVLYNEKMEAESLS